MNRKKYLLMLIVICMLICHRTSIVSAGEGKEVSFIEHYWDEISEMISLKQDNDFFTELEQKEIHYEYQNNRRISKTVNGETTYFLYDTEGQLIEETYDGVSLIYRYDEYDTLTEIEYNNVVYYTETDVDGSVLRIINTNNECVVEYIYTGGTQYIKSENKGGEFDLAIGELNKVRLYSLYYDDETGFYYSDGRFYDAKTERFVDKLSENDMVNMCNYSMMSRSSTSSIGNDVTQWANYLLNCDSNYGKTRNAVNGWYQELSDVEILARLIYGENTVNRQDQKAIMWVLLNRSYERNQTLRQVATASYQFETIWGVGSRDARKPNVSSDAWKYATWLACMICTTTNESECMSLVNKPNGIDKQTSFRSLSSFVNYCRNSSSGEYIIMYTGYGDRRITDVVIVGDLCNEYDSFWISHVVDAKSIEELNIDSCCGYSEGYHNIFFIERNIN